ncbi:MAG TPA: hypothetical protein VFG74_04005 [Miltoncostaeaceae bacterium]|jgi:hypothetical protein|nr:hypothetical protein [Miltoncostaeaceae bacterium]
MATLPHVAAAPALDAATPRPAAVARAAERPERRAYGMVLRVGAGVVVALPVLALAGTLALLALAVTGPYLGLATVSVAYALLALIATAATA